MEKQISHLKMEQAIKKAIEGGWEKDRFLGYFVDETQKPSHKNAVVLSSDNSKGQTFIGYKVNFNDAFLDPFFWQSLGKAMGWKEFNVYPRTSWLAEWHSFIDHLASGGDPEEFFNQLLK